jgi:hypothetical protein
MGAEQRRVPLCGPEDRVANPRSDETRQQRRGVKVVAVEDLGGQYRAAQRRAEDRPDPRTDSGRDRHPGVDCVEVEHPSQQRTEPGADLAGRAFTSTRTARSNRQRRRHQLDQHGL